MDLRDLRKNFLKSMYKIKNFIHKNGAIWQVKQVLPQIMAVMVKNVILIAYGMSYGFPTILIPGVSGENPDEQFFLNEEQISWIGSISPVFATFGCLCSGTVSHILGTKMTMQYVSIFILASWLIFKFSNALWQVYFALALGGFMGGITETAVLMYVSDITQPHLRGILSASTLFSTNLGLVVLFLLATCLDWRTIALWSCILPIASFCLLFFIPESPHWLIIKHKPLDARKSLMWLRGCSNVEDIEEEFQEILLDKNIENATDLEFGQHKVDEHEERLTIHLRYFTKKNFLWPFSIVSFAFFLVHFTGVTTLQTYAVQIFETLEAPIGKYHATVFFGISKFMGSLACSMLIHHMGRRLICFVSMISSGICFSTVATYAYLLDIRYFNVLTIHTNLNLYNWIPTVLLNFSTFISCCGLRALPWILMGEVYSYEARVTGTSISGAMSYFFGFLANKVFLQMVLNLTLPGTYWFYGLMSLFGVLILYIILPETEGKSLQEISDHFSTVSKSNHSERKT